MTDDRLRLRGRKVRAPQGRMLDNVQAQKCDGKRSRKQTARKGKGEMAR